MYRGLPERADSVSYAECLYRYAAPRLDPFSLRCWVIQRLTLDEGLEHGCAEDVFEDVRAKGQDAARRGLLTTRSLGQ